MESNLKIFTLQQIAEWQLEKKTTEEIFVEIPSLQRGLVWNATQAEVLWDSLMRGIPIGTFSLIPAQAHPEQQKHNNSRNRNYENTFWLLDGQQRANSIAMGFRDFDCQQKDPTLPILWLDLMPEGKSSNRAFFFRVTTAAHPWGYKISDAGRENQNTPLSAGEQKKICDDQGITQLLGTIGEKPKPVELWPARAGLPIPFHILTALVSSSTEVTRENIISKIENTPVLKESKWWANFSKLFGDSKFDLQKIKRGLTRIESTRIFAVVAPDDLMEKDTNQSDERDHTGIATFFQRMNKSGVEPSNDDINYSILKSIAPIFSCVDELAKKRMGASRLAYLAMVTFVSHKEKKWHGSISRSKVYELAQDNDFQKFIEHELGVAMNQVQGWLKGGGLLPIHCTYLAHKNHEVFQLLLLLALQKANLDGKTIAAVATLLAWFGKTAASILYNAAAAGGEIKLTSIRLGLFAAISAGVLDTPPPPGYFAENETEGSSEEKLRLLSEKTTDQRYRSAVEKIRNWNSSAGQEMLLFSCREFMKTVFRDFDPAQCTYSEENRPWDYDHIFPRSWLKSGQGNRHGMWHDIIDYYINSIGNIAPLPFRLNREKKDAPPGNYCDIVPVDKSVCSDKDDSAKKASEIKTYNEMLMLKPEKWFHDNNNGKFEDEAEAGLQFCMFSAIRLHCIYNCWYDNLNIENLLDLSKVSNPRNNLFHAVQERISDSKCYFVCGDRQYECTDSSDWAKPWLAIGIVRDKPHKDFVCIASNGEVIEIGIRRHPDESSIDNDCNKWWYKCDNTTFRLCETEQFDVTNIIRKFEGYLHEKENRCTCHNQI